MFEYAGKELKLLNKRMQVYIPTRGWVDMIPETIQSSNNVHLEDVDEMTRKALFDIDTYKRIIEKRIAGLQNYYDHLTDNIQPYEQGRIDELKSLSERVQKDLNDLVNIPSRENSYPYR